MAVLSHHSRLACCRVAVFLGVGYAVLSVCRLMVEEVDTIDDVGETGQIGGIRTVGIGTGRIGRTNKTAVGDDGPIVRDPVIASLDIVYL